MSFTSLTNIVQYWLYEIYTWIFLFRQTRGPSIILSHPEWPVRATWTSVLIVITQIMQSSMSILPVFYPVRKSNKFPNTHLWIFLTLHDVDYYLIVYSISFSDGLFYRIVNRTTKWCIDNSGKEPYCLLKTLARFFLDDEHDFVLEMAPRNFHRIKVPFMNSVKKNYFC